MKPFQILFIFVYSSCVFGQQVTYNHPVDASSSDIKEIQFLFENYVASNPQSKAASQYWNQEEQSLHKAFDFLESEFQPSLYMGLPIHVLSIKATKSTGIYSIKAQFSYCKEDGTPYVLAIVNYIAKKENGSFKLYNALSLNKQKWNCTNVGLVDFYYPNYHTFNNEKAKKLNEFIHTICNNLSVPPKQFEYYFADDFDEIQALKGIDYYIGMEGTNTPRGKAADDKVYCSGLGEYYPHEVFHVQIDAHYPNKHFWVSEGLATYLGGSRGKPLKWHIKRTNNYLKANPEVNLNDLLTLTNLDNQTAYHYVLGGLIAKRIFEKGGWSLIKEFMSSGTTDEAYYKAVEKHLEVKKEELNIYLRKQLDIESKRVV